LTQYYSSGIFAKKTGVTVRTLHYYDELGILTPHYKESGRRYYDDSHFVTMQKIVTLKFLGYSLEEMKELLLQNNWEVRESLLFQKRVMEEKIHHFQQVLKALDHAIHLSEAGEKMDANIFTSIIQGIQLEDEHKEWLKSIYSEERVKEILGISSDKQQEFERKYATILSVLKGKCGRNPNDAEVQQLVSELMQMLQDIVGEDLASFFEKTNTIEIEEEPLHASPLTFEEEEWVREAIKIYLKNAGIEEKEI
jgi:DNA-binding transcriptional MerR regulator